MVEELVARVFAARNIAHLEHWKTKSYAKHMALGSFYDDVIEALDAFIEAHQGMNGIIGDVPRMFPSGIKDVAKFLVSEVEWIESNREELTGNSGSLGNLLDSVSGIYMTTIYKLENLQ